MRRAAEAGGDRGRERSVSDDGVSTLAGSLSNQSVRVTGWWPG